MDMLLMLNYLLQHKSATQRKLNALPKANKNNTQKYKKATGLSEIETSYNNNITVLRM
jgi:hypothetical protein